METARKRSRLRRILAAFLIVLTIGLTGAGYVGGRLVAPHNGPVGDPPPDMDVERVQLVSHTGSPLVGWLTEAPGANGAALLLHGIRADRTSMVGRSRFLDSLGYHTLAIDLQAHGESPGQHITLGHRESQDAAAAVEYLRERFPGQPVVVIGTSLGGAAALLADYAKPPEAFVLEAVYADIQTATSNRIEKRLGPPGRLLAPLLTAQLPVRLGIGSADLRPVDRIARLGRPVFIIHGAADAHCTPCEARAMHAAATAAKQIWEVPGAAHVDYHAHARLDYEERVAAFLDTSLGRR